MFCVTTKKTNADVVFSVIGKQMPTWFIVDLRVNNSRKFISVKNRKSKKEDITLHQNRQ